MDRQQWDERYGSTGLVWTEEPNRFVAEELAGLTAGRALDLGPARGATPSGWPDVAGR